MLSILRQRTCPQTYEGLLKIEDSVSIPVLSNPYTTRGTQLQEITQAIEKHVGSDASAILHFLCDMHIKYWEARDDVCGQPPHQRELIGYWILCLYTKDIFNDIVFGGADSFNFVSASGGLLSIDISQFSSGKTMLPDVSNLWTVSKGRYSSPFTNVTNDIMNRMYFRINKKYYQVIIHKFITSDMNNIETQCIEHYVPS